MAQRRKYSEDFKRAAADRVVNGETQEDVAEDLGVPRGTIGKWVLNRQKGIGEVAGQQGTLLGLQDRVRDLTAQLRTIQRDNLTAENVRRTIFGLAEVSPNPPTWLAPKAAKTRGAPDVPCLMLSDLHWGETVDPAQLNGINEYSLAIANQRLRAVTEKAIYLYQNHVTDHDAPGIVVLLGGDMISGDIHDELRDTNEQPVMPVFLDLLEAMLWTLRRLADAFGRVFVPCVAGNHGRNTVKPRFKQRAFSNFDWLLYNSLEKHFAEDDRVRFLIPDGADAYFAVNGHRFLLTHGDNLGVQGGDGIIGALGPILRGSFKTRNSQSAIGQNFDTIVMGHWHQYLPLPRVIVNGSLKGFDEYAKLKLRATPEAPIQAMWWVSQTYGIVRQDPIFADKPKPVANGPWVAWAA